MSERSTVKRLPRAAILGAITALTVPPDNYPTPKAVADRLGITSQKLHGRLVTLQEAGLIERRNNGHVLKVVAL